MCAALVGGMDRMKQEYITMAKDLGVNLKVFTGQERIIKGQLGELAFDDSVHRQGVACGAPGSYEACENP